MIGGYRYFTTPLNKALTEGSAQWVLLRWVLLYEKNLKHLIYLGCWRSKIMKIFSMRIRNKGKHKFTRTKVSEIVEDKINFFKSLNSK